MNDLALHFGPAALLAAIMFPIALAIKAIADSRARAKLIAADGSKELIRDILLAEEENRRMRSLRWGIVLTCIGGALALIELLSWEELSPGVFAVLLVATGAGNLVFFAIAQSMRARRTDQHSPNLP